MTQLSGSLGGITGSHNAGGLYLRSRAIPVDPGTLRQVTMRAILGGLASRWNSGLTAAQRDGWKDYAANTPITGPLGDPRNVGGIGMYCRANAVRTQIGATIVDAPPVSGVPSLSAPTSVVLSAASGDLTVTFPADPWVNEDDSWLAIYASRQFSPGRTFWGGPYRLLGSIEGDSVTPPTNVVVAWDTVFGVAPTVGEQVAVQLRVADAAGRLSPAVQQRLLVTA